MHCVFFNARTIIISGGVGVGGQVTGSLVCVISMQEVISSSIWQKYVYLVS